MDATFSHIKEFLECSVCLEELDETCKVLPCQHTFCKKCLENIIASKGSLQCPECRTDFGNQRLQSLPPNVLLIRILEGLKRKPNAKTSDGNASTSNNKGYPRLLKVCCVKYVQILHVLTVICEGVNRECTAGRSLCQFL